jgi:hypothetical protein
VNDPVLRKVLGDAINTMRSAPDDAAKLLAIRKCSRALDLSLSDPDGAMGLLRSLAIENHDLDPEDVIDAIAEGQDDRLDDTAEEQRRINGGGGARRKAKASAQEPAWFANCVKNDTGRPRGGRAAERAPPVRA